MIGINPILLNKGYAMVIKTLTISLLCGIISCCALSGCAVPLLTGLKEIQTTKDGSRYSFITGADFHIGANGIDKVDDKRGINIDKSTQK